MPSGVEQTDRAGPPRPRCRRLTGFRVLATGSYVPDAVITNDHLFERFGFDSDWIVKRTGILERRHALPHQATSDLALEAVRRCLDRAGVRPRDIDLCLVGTGSYVPDAVVNNDHLQQRFGFDSDWIVKRTGIYERRHALPNEATSDLCLAAINRCIDRAGVDPRDIDLLLVGTFTPDYSFPSTACLLQDKLKLVCPAVDMQAACTSNAEQTSPSRSCTMQAVEGNDMSGVNVARMHVSMSAGLTRAASMQLRAASWHRSLVAWCGRA